MTKTKPDDTSPILKKITGQYDQVKKIENEMDQLKTELKDLKDRHDQAAEMLDALINEAKNPKLPFNENA